MVLRIKNQSIPNFTMKSTPRAFSLALTKKRNVATPTWDKNEFINKNSNSN
jgi:hypothetical protein